MSPGSLEVLAGADWPESPAARLAINAELAAKSAQIEALNMALNVMRDTLHTEQTRIVAAQSRREPVMGLMTVEDAYGAIDSLDAAITEALAGMATEAPFDPSAL
jgi:hypothetical protein